MSDTWLSRIRKSLLLRVVLTPIGIIAIALQLSLYVVVPLVGVGIFVYCTLAPVQRVWEAKAWQETPCTITKSQVETSGRKDSFVPRVEYEYTYEYKSSRLSFGGRFSDGGFSTTREYCQRVVDEYPLDSQRVCFVNPALPSESVLDRGYPWGQILLGLLGIPIALLFPGLMANSLFRKRLPSVDTQGPVRLCAQESPLSSLHIAVTLLAFVAIITATGYFEGELVIVAAFGWFTALAAFYVVHVLLSLLNPRLTVTVSRFPIPADEDFGIEWRFRGSTRRLRKLTMTLEGPKDGQRKSSRLHTIDIAETEDGLAQGKVLCAVPADARPSGEDGHTKATRDLCFHCTTPSPLWPDVWERFEVRIVPGRDGA